MGVKLFIPQSIKNIYHLFQAVLANFWFGFSARIATRSVAGGPSRKIKVIGITGTNGKTTTAQMVAKILEEAGYKTAIISTINFKLGEKEWVNKTKFTTLSSWATQKFIKKAVDAKCDYLVLETSSHSLDQNRVWGVKYNTAVITNITREHLDYHKTMEKYRRAKLKLFKNAEVAVVNLEMKCPEEFILGDKNKIYGYTLKNQKSKIKNQKDNARVKIIQTKNVKLESNYSKFQILNSKFHIYLPGRFNIENALAAVCVGLAEGISLETSAKALEKIKGIPGRMESVPNDKGLNVIIDYAVTPDSLEKLYELIMQIKRTLPLEKGDLPEMLFQWQAGVRRTEGFEKNSKFLKSSSNSSLPTGQAGFSKGGEPKIVAVLGACGERDRGKRPIMGEIVSRFADYIIITNEDPYDEDPAQIINEVFRGVVRNQKSPPKADQPLAEKIKNPMPTGRQENDKSKFKKYSKTEGVNAWRVMDRREAIKKALRMAKPGDFIIITGKGAEETMAIGNKRIPWNDKKVIMQILANYRNE